MTGPAPVAPSESAVVVSTAWLEANLATASSGSAAAGDLCVVDVRGLVRPPGQNPRYLPKRAEYDESHIPGAVFIDWTRDIVDLDDPVPAQVARPEPFAALMSALGIGERTLVVAYDDYNHAFAGRFAWALRYYGHDTVRVLDGGWSRWKAESRPTTADVPLRAPATFVPRPRKELKRSADEVERSIGKAGVLLIDARPAEQYEGRKSAAARAGHIPGAVNVPYATLVDASTGRFRDPADLRAAFAAAGVDADSLPGEVIVYCNGGVTCSVPLHALRMLRPERDDVAVYDGSWNEWGNDPRRPARGGNSP